MYKGKVVVITGASGGIGVHIAKEYAKLNANVIAIDIIPKEFEEENIEFLKIDLENANDIIKAFDYIVNKYNKVNVLINNGAISKFNKSIHDIQIEEFDKVIDINLRATFICSKEFIKGNSNETYGRIINIASTRYNQNESGWEAYGASKGGMVSLTNTMTISLSDTPITVNTISPGWIQCENYDTLTEIDHKQHPSKRVGKPMDIVKACMFLSDEENDFVNGINLIVDGGITKKMIYE